MELNSINKTGTWSEAADRLNNNFSKTSTELEKVKQNGIRNKGLFPTLESLKAAVPSPVVGDWAVVGDTIRALYINARQREHGVPLARQEVAEVLTYPAT